MSLEEFCVALNRLDLTQPQQAIAVLWFLDQDTNGASQTAGELAKILRGSGLGNPHSTRLGESVFRSGHVLRSGKRLRIKPTSRSTVEKWVSKVLNHQPPKIDQDRGFIPKAIWINARSYVKKIAAQINGCYEYGFYDGASVLVRRLIETLLIDSCEHLNIEQKIKQGDGNYPMLGKLITGAVDQGHLSLGRETKKALAKIKESGDRSAHNHRYTAVKADLDKIQSGVRVAVEELLHLSGQT